MKKLISYLLVPLFLFTSLYSLNSAEKKTICLNMIVKNERHVIQRCLDSVKGMIDYWVIVDTGSTDGTQEIIKQSLKDIPGELFERPWKGFGYNRTEALKLAESKADYLLFMDADDWLEFEPGFNLELDSDCHLVKLYFRDVLSLEKQLLVKADLGWEWVGEIHEYLYNTKCYHRAKLEKIRYVYGADGNRSKDPEKYLKDIKVLEEALKEAPYNSRYQYYLAESLKASNQLNAAIEAYKKRVCMKGDHGEIFFSLLRIGQIQEQLGLSIEEVGESYLAANSFAPHRAEPVYYLAATYNKQGDYAKAYQVIKDWEKTPQPIDTETHIQLDWIMKYGIDFQYSLAVYYLGYTSEFLDKCDLLLGEEGLPICWREWLVQKKYLTSSTSCDKTVLITTLVKNKAHLLDKFLESIFRLDYDKSKISIHINTNNNLDNTLEILEEWVEKNKKYYSSIVISKQNNQGIFLRQFSLKNPVLNLFSKAAFYGRLPGQVTPLTFGKNMQTSGKIWNDSLQRAKALGCDYFFAIDCNNFIAPCTLKELIGKQKPIVAPLLKSSSYPLDLYSNFFADVNEQGDYKESLNYLELLNREKKGTFEVPVVCQTYLVDTRYIEKLSYTDESEDEDFIVFSRQARLNGVSQYLCNERDFGTLFHIPEGIDLDTERQLWNKKQLNPIKVNYRVYNSTRDEPIIESALNQQREELKASKNPEEQYGHLLQIALMQQALRKNQEAVIQAFLEAHQCFPTKIEPLFELSKYYRKINKNQEAYQIAAVGLKIAKGSNNKDWLSEYGMAQEYSLACQAVGNYQEALDIGNSLLKIPTLREDVRETIQRNCTFFSAALEPEPPNKKSLHAEEARLLSKRFHVCTVASYEHKNLSKLRESCHKNGIDLEVLGMGLPYLSNGTKFVRMASYLDTLPEDHVVMFVDAFDVLILSDKQTILEKFLDAEASILLSAEKNCYPYPVLEEYFTGTDSPFRFLNTGGCIGYVSHLKKWLKALSPEENETKDDQGQVTEYYVQHYVQNKTPPHFVIDHSVSLFLCLNQVEDEEILIQDGSVRCLSTNSRPCVVHANGNSFRIWDRVYEGLIRTRIH